LSEKIPKDISLGKSSSKERIKQPASGSLKWECIDSGRTRIKAGGSEERFGW